MACADTNKRLQRSAVPGDSLSKVLDAGNTSSSLSPVQATPLDYDDLLKEILLRLPPKPSSLPRASLVCKRWRNILSDPQFLKRFRIHHGKPPLLGFFTGTTGTAFVPVPDMKPNSIPAERFAVPKSSSPVDHWDFLDCRHGLAVMIHQVVQVHPLGREVFAWDPLTGEQRCLSFPQGLRKADRDTFSLWHAAVLCADAEDGHVHGDCLSSPFKVVLICSTHKQTLASLYDSRLGVWGNISSTATTEKVALVRSNILIGNAVYWLSYGGDVLVFDIDRQTLGVIEKPTDAHHTSCWSFQLCQTDDDSCLGLAVMLKSGIQLWMRNSNCDDAEWVLLHRIIPLTGLFSLGVSRDLKGVTMVGYDEDSNSIILTTHIGDFTLQLESMRFCHIFKRKLWCVKIRFPYRAFYTPGGLRAPTSGL